MAKFDEQKFRSSAKAAGYSDEEIDAELKSTPAPAGAAVPNIVPIADGRETTAAFEKEAQAKGAELITSAKQEQEATLAAPPFDFMKALNSPVGYVTGGAALGALAVGGAYGLSKLKTGLSGINQRKIGQQPIDRTIDIPMDTIEKRNMSPFAQQFETTYGVPLADAERLTGGPITNPKDAAIIGGALKNQGGISVNSPYQTSSYTQAPAPIAPTAPATPQATAPVAPADPLAPRPNPYMTPSVQESVATGNTAQAVQTVIAQELDKATGVAPAEKPAPKAKKPIDPSEVGLTKQEIGMKRYLESFYGGGEVGAKTYGQVGEILGYRPAFEPGKGGGLKPEENLVIKDYRKENIAGPKVNLDKEMKRALKGGAGAAALMAIPGFATAAQNKDYGRMVDLATDFVIPPFAGSSELGVSTLGQQQTQNVQSSALLGSPYAQTEWAKNQRLKEKAGAGRGIAPPSAYMR